jgi:hypothetical protein
MYISPFHVLSTLSFKPTLLSSYTLSLPLYLSLLSIYSPSYPLSLLYFPHPLTPFLCTISPFYVLSPLSFKPTLPSSYTLSLPLYLSLLSINSPSYPLSLLYFPHPLTPFLCPISPFYVLSTCRIPVRHFFS